MNESPAIMVLMGGPDAEYEVSLASGQAVVAALEQIYPGAVQAHVIPREGVSSLKSVPGSLFFPVLHGPWGEGGPLQRLLEQDGRPFVGCGVAAAETAMDKHRTKCLARELGIPTPAWELVEYGERTTLEPPVVLKPPREGSSIGIQIAHTVSERDACLASRPNPSTERLVEAFIQGREVTVGIVGDQILPVIEIVPVSGTYDYEAKYQRSDTRYVVSPTLPDGTEATLQTLAMELFQAIDARHVARIDFRLDAAGPWMLEINTMPGFTPNSLLPKAAAAHGWELPELCGRLVEMARNRSPGTG